MMKRAGRMGKAAAGLYLAGLAAFGGKAGAVLWGKEVAAQERISQEARRKHAELEEMGVKLGLCEKRGQTLVQQPDIKARFRRLRPEERRKLVALADKVRGFNIVSPLKLKRMKPVAAALSAATMLALGLAELAGARKLAQRFQRK